MTGGGRDVIDRRPLNRQQVEAQHHHRGDRQPLQNQHLDDIGLLVDDGAPGAGDNHQPVADQEAAHAGDDGGTAGVGQPRPVGRLVAPLAKVPNTMVMAADQLMVSPGSIWVIACQPPA